MEPAVEAGSRRQQMWPVTVVWVFEHTDYEQFQATGSVGNHVCRCARCDKARPGASRIAPLVTQCIIFRTWHSDTRRFPLLFHLLAPSLSPSLSSISLLILLLLPPENPSPHSTLLTLHLHSSICVSISPLSLTAGVPYPGLFMSSKISH